ncbi:T-cell immunoglobulin and mucin domain-containing protein 4-like isoform X2 [Petaurus breviceps papuanus]
MCWGKEECPKSKCGGEVIRTDGKRVTWSKSSKYQLQGNLWRGDVTLTIKNTNEGDIGTYCCRVEVPGWFNDIKIEVVLQLEKVPTSTTHQTMTTRLTTTLPTTTYPPTTTQLATTLLPTTTPLPAITTHLAPTTCPTTTATTALQITTSAIPNLTTIMTHQLTTVTLKSTTVLPQKSASNQAITPALTTLPLTEIATVTTETASFPKNDSQLQEATASGDLELLIIIAPLVGFVILLMLLVFILRGKIIRKDYSVTYKRSNNAGEVSSANLPSKIEEDEEGLFNL